MTAALCVALLSLIIGAPAFWCGVLRERGRRDLEHAYLLAEMRAVREESERRPVRVVYVNQALPVPMLLRPRNEQ